MKRMTILAAALLCVALTATALADTGATLVREGLSDTDWIRGTSRLSVEGEPIAYNGSNYRAYSMTALDGTALTDAIYASLKGDTGYVVATSLQGSDLMNADGLLDVDGNVLIPCEYGDIDVLSTEWAAGVKLVEATSENYDYSAWFSDSKYLVDTVDIYHLPEGAKLATFTRSEYKDARAVNHCVNVENRATGEITTYDAAFNALGTVKYTSSDDFAPADYETYYENRHYGIRDVEGNVVLEPTYASIYSAYQGMRRVKADDDTSGLITDQGAVIVAPAYDDIISTYKLPSVAGETSGYVAAGYVAVKMDGKLGYVDVNGNLTCEPKYIADNMDVRGASATVADPLTGNIIMVAADGVETTVEGYDRIYPLDYGSGVYYEATDSNYNYGMIDWHGNVIFPTEYRDIELSGDGRYALVEVDYHTANLYELTYPEVAVVEAPAAEASAQTEQAASGSGSATATMLTNAAAMLSADAVGNKDTVVQLLQGTVTLLGSGNDAVVNLLGSAITLLEVDAASNAASVVTLLESAAGML